MPQNNNRQKTVAVIGIGRVGLPLSLVLTKEGFEVIGVDVDEDRLRLISNGKMPFLEEGTEEILKEVYGNGFIAVHENALPYLLPKVDIIILTLGTTIDDSLNPNLSQITGFFEKFHASIRKGQLLILRSTLSVGTTEYIAMFVKKNLNLEVGKDIYLAACPERIAEGRFMKEIYELPQIIGADDPKSQEKAKAIFNKIIDRCFLTDSKSAELAKLFNNAYRYIDFAVGNEFMLIAESHNRNIYDILKFVNEDYERARVKPPGLTAGSCLVKDSFFLIDRSPYLDLIGAAWRINENVPGFLIEKLGKEVGSLAEKKVALLGLAFKRDIDDTRNSLSLKLQQYLIKEGAEVYAHDPYIDSSPLEEALYGADVVVIAMNHSSFKNLTLDDIAKVANKKCVVCDIWNLLGTNTIVFSLPEKEAEKGLGKVPKSNGQRNHLVAGSKFHPAVGLRPLGYPNPRSRVVSIKRQAISSVHSRSKARNISAPNK